VSKRSKSSSALTAAVAHVVLDHAQQGKAARLRRRPISATGMKKPAAGSPRGSMWTLSMMSL